MDKNNDLSWRSQFIDVLELHDLEDVITYDTHPPKKHVDGTPNPAYSKDKLVLSWIKATASSTIKTLLIPCTTAHEAWDPLERRLSPLSKTYLHTLWDQICTLKRDLDKPVADYLMHTKSLFDSLTIGVSLYEPIAFQPMTITINVLDHKGKRVQEGGMGEAGIETEIAAAGIIVVTIRTEAGIPAMTMAA
ncbi:PREDICTED: UBN2_3 domain-containing [Prunus dulcis]|uniref:PREDICTED: UBN2_3 domain-containing n=1 Tax=Prunus dulcis TaxID=3755 RepID=A0A5E4G1W4_PRUDU|nr:PREDICTED: UBN2_3 domain-containing [Prunus dulcis]